jgi:hypothetical protein
MVEILRTNWVKMLCADNLSFSLLSAAGAKPSPGGKVYRALRTQRLRCETIILFTNGKPPGGKPGGLEIS